MLNYLLHSPWEAFIFDCDGTIGDTMAIYHRAWNWALRHMNGPAPIPWKEFCANGGRNFRDTVLEYNARHRCQLDVARVLEHLELYMKRNLHHFLPIQPVVELIRAEGKRPMAVASSGLRETVHFILNRLGIFEKFKAILTQEDVIRDGVPRVKPLPDLFLLAAEKLAVDPMRCLVFEDSPLGAAAAAAAGMGCQLIPHGWWNDGLRTAKFPLEEEPAAETEKEVHAHRVGNHGEEDVGTLGGVEV